MPRERVHWEVLAEAARRCGSGSAVGQLLTSQLRWAELGAVAHDAPYYLEFGGSRHHRVGEFLHGLANADTFAPLRVLLQGAAGKPDGALLNAFTLGMLSHAVTDQIFHPWIFAVSGNYYDPDPVAQRRARARHRLVEVWLDSWVVQRFALPRESELMRKRAQSSSELHAICNHLTLLIPSTPQDIPAMDAARWQQAFTDMGRIQSMAFSAPFGAALRALFHLAPTFFAPYDGLSRFAREGKLPPGYSGSMEYLHPVTGQRCTRSLDQLFESSVQECVRLFAMLDAHCVGGASLGAFATEVGSSLNYGVLGVAPEAATFFEQPSPTQWGIW